MKIILSFAACLLLTVGINAQNTGKSTNLSKGMGDKYVAGYSKNACVCAVTDQGGKLVVERNGAPVNGEIVVAPAVKITSDGRLKKDGGAERMLTNGNCVSDKGTITMQVK